MFYGIVLAFTEFAIRMIQPIALGQLILYYTPNQTTISKDEAYMYAGAVVLCSLIYVFIIHPYMMGIVHLGMKLRVACCSLIYRKALRLSKTALGQTTAGQLVNLLSNDVNRFDVAVLFAHQLWVGPLETIVITYLMYLQIGISAVIGVAALLCFIPLQFWLGKKTSVLRLKTAIRTDERVRLMNEIISGVQVIKMYTWEKPFANLVSLARKHEIRAVTGASYVRGVLLSFIMFSTRISIFISIFAYILFGKTIYAEQVFVITSFYSILRQSMTIFFPQGIGQIAEANISIKRLNNFLMYDENKILCRDNKTESIENGSIKDVKDEIKPESAQSDGIKGISIKNITAKWSETSTENTLSNLSMELRPGKLIAVIGPVGSGKTSLLHAILKELPLEEGTLNVNGEISYASQEPWLFAGTVRQNILFGLPMERARYKMVVKRCALERDFTLLPHGDKTIVGERGVSLSGGQRARINLARAVYKQADIYLLDDPLSAVDTHVGKQLFEECVAGYLREKMVILITHQLQYLKEVDHIVILENGVIKAEGSYNDLRNSGLDFAKLLHDQPNEVEEKPEALSFARQGSVLSMSSTDEKTLDLPSGVDEQKSVGSVSGYVYKAYFQAGGNCCIVFMVMFLFILAQFAASAGDYFITFWVNLEQLRFDRHNLNTTSAKENDTTYDFNSASNSNLSFTKSDSLKQSTNDTTTLYDLFNFNRETCIYIYSGITIATIIISLVRSFAFFKTCMRSSIRLHNRMFENITRATMRFFNTNPSGRILNRFSKDMGAIDELLPSVLIDCLQIGLTLTGIIVVVAIVNPWLLLPTCIVGVIFYLLRNFYLVTGRSVKRLEGVTRSPVFSHLNASLQGLTTIRAFKAQEILEKEFDNHQDLHSCAWHIFLCTSRAFGFWLDLVCIVYIAIVTMSFLFLGDEKFGGNVGLAITQSIGLTGMFQWGMRQSTELENQMTSVERVLEYTDVEQEDALETPPAKKPPKTWPENGKVEFSRLYLKYAPEEQPVLSNLNFVIQPREKVGIVGRTGAGKSSLISALFRLAHTDGQIFIDDVDTKDLGLHDLRSKISIIPQEPVLFSGTMRKNLDPFDEYTDATLWKALEDVELKEVVEDLTAGLNSKMSEGGSNFSVGQRQLVCLARAIIRNNKVLVLDEATANVDPQTDALIQTTIRKKFAECTVLTIAHRLHTVMDSDKVLVMDAGTMVEFDHPYLLLQDENGFLHGMVQKTGRTMAEALMLIAQQVSLNLVSFFPQKLVSKRICYIWGV
ncbi:atp-binding cassette sub-family c [Holotrichia oblita]|uniref:Atp-binding cassette sub-family c n=1 Tax=Holotrichia oblita TaxID=644536 RepID=A0ACB9TCT6_HOLOL|nr:atp-binding cassette sub-family c [Holotrichia oblita]